jgi:hypothetical protein
MNTKPIPYEVGYQITEHRSTVVWARSEAEAVAKAKAIDYYDPELFEMTTGVPEFWTAHAVES